jgi:hypothetical protein
MKKMFLSSLILMMSLIPSFSFCQSKLDEAKQKLIGTWKFEYLYSLTATAGEPTEPCVKAIVYHFKADGTAVMENADTTICKYGNDTRKWSVIILHDERGKEHYAVRITEDGVGERASYEGNTYTDEIYMFISFKNKFFTWIPKPQYKVPSANDMQSFYRKQK